MREHHDTTVLLCTHDMAEAQALADGSGSWTQGRLLALEPAERCCAGSASAIWRRRS